MAKSIRLPYPKPADTATPEALQTYLARLIRQIEIELQRP